MRHRIRKNFLRPAAEESEFERRRSKKRRGGLRLLVRVMIVCVALFALFVVSLNWKDIAPDNFVAWVEDVINGTTGGSYPVSLTGDNVADMRQAGGNLVMLTDTATVYYNESGGESVRRTCSYAQPLMKVNDKYVLLLETGGHRFRLETRSDSELEHTLEGKITTGNVSKKGDVAVVTEATQSHLSEVIVFSAKGETRYQWLSSDWLVIDCAFSSDGNSLAVTACATKEGSLQSTLLVFDLRSAETQPKQYHAESVLYTSVTYTESGTVIAIGDKHCRFVNPTGTLDATVSYDENEIIGHAFGENDIAVALRGYGTQDSCTVRVFSSSGDQKATHAVAGDFRDIGLYGDGFLVLTDRNLYDLKDADILHTKAVEADSLMTGAVGKTPLVLGLTELNKIEWDDTSSKKE